MKKKHIMYLLLMFSLLLNSTVVSTQEEEKTGKVERVPGIIYQNEDGEKVQLKIKSVDVDVKVLGTVAVTTMDILFENVEL